MAIGDEILVTVTNTGTVDIAAGTLASIGYYISVDSVITTADRLLAGGRENLNQLTNGLAVGESAPITLFSGANISSTFPDTNPPSGNVFIGVLVDEFDAISESDETDNTASQAILIGAPKPDLIVRNLTHDPASPDSATMIDFTAEVKNIGPVSAGPSTLCFAIGDEGDCTVGAVETNFSVPSLGANETFEVQRSQRFAEILVDTMFTNTAVADFDNEVAESDEINNETIDMYTVTAAAPTQLFATITTLPTSGTLTDSNNTPITIANTSLPDTMVTYVSSSTADDFFACTLTDPSTGLTSLSLEAVVELGISGVVVGLFCADGRVAGNPH